VVRFAQGTPLRIELLPRDRPASHQMPRGTRATSTDDPQFDRDFLLQSNDVELARSVFAAEAVRRTVQEVRQLCPPHGVLLSVNPERLLLQIDRNLGHDVARLDLAVRGALLLHDWIVDVTSRQISRGVDVVEVGRPAPEHGPATCEICFEAIVGAHVACAACHTPFHADCWTFTGHCATFGCQGRTFVKRTS
jgi:hypothetical protein